MQLEDLSKGVIINGPKWPESIEVNAFESLRDCVRIIGVTTSTGKHVDQVIPLNELNSISIRKIENDFKADPWKVFLSLEKEGEVQRSLRVFHLVCI